MKNNYKKTYSYALCHNCDLLSEVPTSFNKKNMMRYHAECPNCHAILSKSHSKMKRNTIIYSCCSLFMLLISFFFVSLQICINGRINSLNIFHIPTILSKDNDYFLAIVFLVFVFIFPAVSMILQILLCCRIRFTNSFKRQLLFMYQILKNWGMPEIFIVGILISFIKLSHYGELNIRDAFWSFCLFMIFYLKSLVEFSKQTIWNEIKSNNFVDRKLQVGEIGISQNIRLCLCCHAILPSNQTKCPRCKKHGSTRKQYKIQWIFALLVTALMLYIPANFLGMMNTVFLGSNSSSTIIDGVIFMWQSGDYPVALIIFIASIIIPIFKILSLFWLTFFVIQKKDRSYHQCLTMNRLYHIVELIGRWSMIDVFVVAIISALVRNGEIISVYPDIGILFFTLVVIVTMIASQQYDSRLIWDKQNFKVESGKLCPLSVKN